MPHSAKLMQGADRQEISNGSMDKEMDPLRAQGPNRDPSSIASKDGQEKLSSAVLKKRKQQEKAARRAQTVQSKSIQQGFPDLKSSNGDSVADGAKKAPGSTASGGATAKGSHDRVSSVAKNMPLRVTQTQNVDKLTPTEKKKDVKKVALFGHLYGHSRRSTIIGAAKDVHPAVLALGLQMSNYVICGSSARCVATMLAFKKVIESYTTPPLNSLPRHLTSHLSPQIDYLVSCRPLSISMGNAIRWLKVEINNVDPDTDESEAKADICSSIDKFILERITLADQAIATSAASKIQNGDVVLIFAKSNIVQEALIKAFKLGRQFRVIVIDSRPLFEGKTTARSLASAGIKVQYSFTHSLSHCICSATKVFLGAHSMLGNGRLYARVGSAVVAMTAKAQDVPVIVCCESIKFTDKVALDSIVTNEVAPPDELVDGKAGGRLGLFVWKDLPNLQLLNLMYDVTPADYITMVITEYGTLPPSSVPVVHALSTNT